MEDFKQHYINACKSMALRVAELDESIRTADSIAWQNELSTRRDEALTNMLHVMCTSSGSKVCKAYMEWAVEEISKKACTP